VSRCELELGLGTWVFWVRARDMGQPDLCAVRIVRVSELGRVLVEHDADAGEAWVWPHELVASRAGVH